MPYIISAIVMEPDVGNTSEHGDTATAAIEKAVELMGLGMKEVQITDPQGRTYGPEDFDRLLVEAKDVR